MERDFRYLREKYGDAGARENFEKICTQLLQSKFENAHNVKAEPGDNGIDIYVGDFNKEIEIYQCKYFIDGIEKSQKQQISKSYETAKSKNSIKSWYLCLPCLLNVKEHKWWSEWKSRMEALDNIPIVLYDGSFLLNQIKKYNIYNTNFDDDIRNSLDEILKFLVGEKDRIYNEIIYNINEFEETDYDDCIFVKKLKSANIMDIDDCKNDFFNAEIVKHIVDSKGDENEKKIMNQLKLKIHGIWYNQYRLYKNETNGTQLLSQTYMRIEEEDTTTLKSIDEINLFAKKGMLHQLAEDCSIGWINDYKEKLVDYMQKEGETV